MKSRITVLLGMLLLAFSGFSQVNIQIISGTLPTPTVSELVKDKQLIKIIVTNTGTTARTLKVVGKLKLEGTVVSETTVNTASVRSFILSPGQTETKYVDNIVDFSTFDLGVFGTTILRTNTLPAGRYEGCATVYDAETGLAVSTESCTTFDLTDYYPAELLAPVDGEILTNQVNIFTWSRINPYYKNGGVTYSLKIWALPEGLSPAAVIQNDANVVETINNIPVENYPLNMLTLNLLEDQRYVWTIQAYNNQGVKVATQSIPRFFKYGKDYTADLLAHIKLLELHEELFGLYLDAKKASECVGKPVSAVKGDFLPKINAVQTKMDNLLALNSKALSSFSSSITNLTALKQRIFVYGNNIGNELPYDVFGESIKTAINTIKPGAYSLALLDVTESCADLVKTKEKQPKQTKEEKKKAEEDDYLEKLAASCDYSASIVENAAKRIAAGGKSSKEYPAIEKAGFDLYTKYTTVQKKVSKERLAEEKNKQGFEKLAAVLAAINTIKQDKDKAVEEAPDAILNLRNAARLFRGLDPLNNPTKKTKALPNGKCYFTDLVVAVPQQVYQDGWLNKTNVSWKIEGKVDKIKFKRFNTFSSGDYNEFDDKEERELSGSTTSVDFQYYGGKQNIVIEAYIDEKLVSKGVFPIFTAAPKDPIIGNCEATTSAINNKDETQVSKTKEKPKKTEHEIAKVVEEKNMPKVGDPDCILSYARAGAILYQSNGQTDGYDYIIDWGGVDYNFGAYNDNGYDIEVEYIVGGKVVGASSSWVWKNNEGQSRPAYLSKNDDYAEGVTGKLIVSKDGKVVTTVSFNSFPKDKFAAGDCQDEVKKNEIAAKFDDNAFKKKSTSNEILPKPIDGCLFSDFKAERKGDRWKSFSFSIALLEKAEVIRYESEQGNFVVAENVEPGRYVEVTEIGHWWPHNMNTNHVFSLLIENEGKVISKFTTEPYNGNNTSVTGSCATEKIGTTEKEKVVVKETKHKIAKVVEEKGMPQVGDPDCILSYARAGAILYEQDGYTDGYDYIIDWGGVDYNFGSYNSNGYDIQVEYNIGGKVTGANSSWVWKNGEGQGRPAYLSLNDDYAEGVTGKLIVSKDGKVVTTVNFNSFPKDKFAGGDCKDEKIVTEANKKNTVVTKRAFEKGDSCFFTNIKSNARVWANSGNKHYTHDFTWNVNGDADEIKLKYISETDAKGKSEKVLAKNATTESIVLNAGEKYAVSLTAYKGGKAIAKALALKADGGADPIVMECSDDLEGKAELAVAQKANPCANVKCENGGECIDGKCDCPEGYSGSNCQEKIVPKCVFKDIMFDGFGSTINWTQEESFDEVTVSVLNGSEIVLKRKAGKKASGQHSVDSRNIKFKPSNYVQIVGYRGGNAVKTINTATIGNRVNDKGSLGLQVAFDNAKCSCSDGSSLADVKEEKSVEEKGCFFVEVKSSSRVWQNTGNKHYTHDFTWKINGEADELKLSKVSLSDPNGKSEVIVKPNAAKAEAVVNTGEKYNISLIAYKDGKVIAKAISNNLVAGADPIVLECTDDLEEKEVVVVEKVLASSTVNTKEKECMFSNVRSSSKSWGANDVRYDHTIAWAFTGDIDEFKISWYKASDISSKQEKIIGKQYRKIEFTLDKDENYIATVTAYKGGKAIAKVISSSFVGSIAAIDFKCTDDLDEKEVTVIEKDLATKDKSVEEKGCLFSNVKSYSKVWNDKVSYTHYFTWELNGEADELKIASKSSSDQKGWTEVVLKKGSRKTDLVVSSKEKYDISLFAYKGGKIIAKAIVNGATGGKDPISLTCTNDLNEEKAVTVVEKVVATKEKSVEEKGCFFVEVKSSSRVWQNTGNKHYTHDFTWKINGEADELKLSKVSLSDPNGKSEVTVKPNAAKAEAVVNTGEKYNISLIAYKDGKVIAKAISNNLVAGADPIVLECTDDLEEKEVVVVEKALASSTVNTKEKECMFSNVRSSSKSWGANDVRYDHTIAWAFTGDIDEFKISWYKASDISSKQEKIIGKQYRKIEFTLDKDENYIATVTAYKGGKAIAKVISSSFIGSIAAIDFKCTDDLEGKNEIAAAKVQEKNDKECMFSNVNSSSKSWGGTDVRYDHTIGWAFTGDLDEFKMSWYLASDLSTKKEKLIGKGFRRIEVTLNKDEKYVVAVTAYKGGKAIAKVIAKSVLGSDATIDFKCTDDLEGKTEQAEADAQKKEAEAKKKEAEEQCLFSDVKSYGQAWSSNPKKYDHAFTYKFSGEADDFKLVAYPVSNYGESLEKKEGKNIRKVQLTLVTDQKYFVSLTAYKDEKAIARATANNVDVGVSSISLLCTDDLEGKNDPKQADKQAPVEDVENCFFTEVKSVGTDHSGMTYYQKFTWNETGTADQVKIVWNEQPDPNVKGEKVIDKDAKNVTIELMAERKYEIQLLALKGGKEFAKAISGTVAGNMSEIVLNCTADSKGTANSGASTVDKTKAVECALSENVTVGTDIGNGVYEHNWMWYSSPDLNKWYLEWKDAENPSDVKHVSFEVQDKNTERVQYNHKIQLKKDKKYILKMIAYSDKKPVAKAESKATLGSAANIFVPCVSGAGDTQDDAIKPKPTKEQMMKAYDDAYNTNCFFYNISSVGVKASESKTNHTFTWKQRGYADYVYVGYILKSNPNTLVDVKVLKGETSFSLELENSLEYSVYIHAYYGGNGFAAAGTPWTKGSESNMFMGCGTEWANSKNNYTGPSEQVQKSGKSDLEEASEIMNTIKTVTTILKAFF